MLNELLKKRFTTRFWDDSKEVPYELIQSVLQDVYDAPRKNGDTRVVVKVLTPSEEGEKMKDELLKLSWCRDGDKAAIDNTGPIRVQGQFTAPYVLLFGTTEETEYDQHNVANASSGSIHWQYAVFNPFSSADTIANVVCSVAFATLCWSYSVSSVVPNNRT